ncbi:MAG TPA: metallophosphoesterase [Kiritimatiellia bacterium]|nr:metallophosphoesterase [Kiritimatiellia bacterium]HRU71339.1 metallophosphoesterase [Kiritimatiellia bacterium]
MNTHQDCSRRRFIAWGATTALCACPKLSFAAADSKAAVRFGIVADCHFARIPMKINRYYEESSAKLAECVRDMNRQNVDFLIELGDFKDQGSTRQDTLSFLKEIEQVFTAFKGPRYHVLGNHDMDQISKAQFMSHIQNTGIAEDKTYYSFDGKGFHFIVLDANFRTDGVAYDSGNYDWRESLIPSEEMQWLAADLAQTNLPTIVFVHQLLDADKGSVYVRNAAEVRRVLEGSKRVLAVFQGHHHAGACQQVNGILYYTLKSVVEGSGMENNAYAVVSVSDKHDLKVRGVGRATSYG